MMTEPAADLGDGAPAIRRAKRHFRSTLSIDEQLDHATRVAQATLTIAEVTAARTVGAYVAVGGELDPAPTLALLVAATYLPLIGDDFTMEFKLFADEHPMVLNRYGIEEPPPTAPGLAPMQLDVVLVPLVAFDGRGYRIGMGAGYYDRAFAARQSAIADASSGPLLVGLAHEGQRVDRVPEQAWDVPLDIVVTEDGVHRPE